jgi:hypothetical protein
LASVGWFTGVCCFNQRHVGRCNFILLTCACHLEDGWRPQLAVCCESTGRVHVY